MTISKKWGLLLLLAVLAAPVAQACTSFLVGKKASACGSAFITYNQDSYGGYGRGNRLCACT